MNPKEFENKAHQLEKLQHKQRLEKTLSKELHLRQLKDLQRTQKELQDGIDTLQGDLSSHRGNLVRALMVALYYTPTHLKASFRYRHDQLILMIHREMESRNCRPNHHRSSAFVNHPNGLSIATYTLHLALYELGYQEGVRAERAKRKRTNP